MGSNGSSSGNVSIPDGYVSFETAEGCTKGFFLEMDRGTEMGSPFVTKANGYKRWFVYPQAWRPLITKSESELSKPLFPPVLVVTTSERRMNNLIANVLTAGPGPIRWYFTHQGRIQHTVGGLLGRIWRKLPDGDCDISEID
jgi:hypothetical protein